jgi:ribosomal protein S19E (S16A)
MDPSLDAREMYRIFTSSGLWSILRSFEHLYIMNLLYEEPAGLTCTMIYCSYKKDLFDQEVLEKSVSRSHIAEHLNDLETEGLVVKGAFKQYVLTEKGKAVVEFARQMALDISKNL